ncbi:MAG: MG2 domain-containing protein [Gammaproteobacteria bacterium]|nr:MG2 domain-containing protein [Gammaproteobacteria bacterium]
MVEPTDVSRTLLFALSCLTVGVAWPDARVEMFSPSGYAKDVRQVTVRFSETMVALGEPGRLDPFGVDCEVPGNGRWIDERNWVYDFDYDVPGAVRCDFILRDDVRTLAGAAVQALPEYAFHTGGPGIVHHEPVWEQIDERQTFMLALDAVAEPDSIRKHVRCRIGPTETAHPVDLLLGTERTTILDAVEAADIGRIRDLVDEASRNLPRGHEHETRNRALERVVLVRCRDPLPAGSDIELVWGAGIAGVNGRATAQERVLSFAVRPAFEAQLECASRFEGRCVGGIHVHFTADVDREIAGRLRLVDEDGTVIAPEESDWPQVDMLRFPGAFRDQTSYRAEAVAPITDIDGRALANAMDFPKTIRVDRLPPGASFGMGLRSVERRSGAVAPVLLRRIDEPLSGRRRDVAVDADIVRWLRRVETAQGDEKDLRDEVASLQSVFEAVEPRDAFTLSPGTSGAPYELAGVPLPGPGFHVVELELPALRSLPRRYVAGLVVVTDLALHIHRAGESSLVWVTGLSDGLPVAGADIAVSDACTGRTIARATTDAAGLARIPRSLPWRDACANFRYLVSARKDGDLALATSGSRWSHRGTAPRLIAHPILDRALYQPGDTVSVKTIVRRPSSAGLVLPGAQARQATVTIKHYGTRDRQQETVDIAADGSALASFDLPTNAKLGNYLVEVDIDGSRSWASSHFRVERFRAGAMRATLDGPVAPLLNTGSVPVTLSVQHLAGGAAASLPVEVRSTVRPWLYYWEDQLPPEPRTTSEILDSNGKAHVDISVPPLERKGVLDVEMDYQDANGQRKTATQRFELWPAAIDLEVEDGDTESLRKRFHVKASRLDGGPAAGVTIEANIYAPRSYTERRLPGGFRASVRADESRLLGTCSGRTDAAGALRCEAPTESSKSVLVEATAHDEHGNAVRTAETAYFYDRANAWLDTDETRRFSVGEVVPIEANLPFDQSTVLVTVHREGVLDAFVEHVEGPKAVVNVPVLRNYAPNVEVSVLAVRPLARGLPGHKARQPVGGDFRMPNDPDFRLGTVDVRVGWDANALALRVEPDRDTYRTRESARVGIAVVGPDGLPRPDAEVALVAVDEGLLDLWPNESWDILKAMMEERYARVDTSTSMWQLVETFEWNQVEEVIVTGSYRRRSGFGGYAGTGEPTLRERFDALLLWRGRLQMDETGKAEVDIPLNDLLTSFRIVAIATAGADLFGTGEATIRTARDLILHAGIPDVVRIGDRFDAVFSLRNASGARRSISVVAEADGVAKPRRKRLRLRPGETREVSWPVTVPAGTDRLDWVVTATDRTAADRLSAKQRVEPAVPVRVQQATLTQLAQPRELPVKVPAGAEPDRGGIRVSLQRSLADNLGSVRDAMSRYRYSCIEQDVSVAVVTDDDERWFSAMVKAWSALDPDGLVRFFPSEYLPGSPVLTAYVLTIADAAQKTVPEDLKDAMIKGLRDFLAGRLVRKPPLRVADSQFRRLSALAALARHDAVHHGMLDGMDVDLDRLPTSALLDWLDILTRTDPVNAQIRAAKAALRARLNLQGTTMGFSTEHRDRLWWLMVSTDANAARTILALLDDPDWQVDLPRMMRGLMGRQDRGRWRTTVANAWGTLAANGFRAAYEAAPIAGTSVVGLGEVRHRSNWSSSGSAAAPEPPAPIELPWSSAETLTLAHDGTGAPWSLIELRAAVPSTDPVERGYRIGRQVEAVERRNAGRWSRGDIARIVLDIDATADMTWVVVEDPLPPGAVVLGSGLGDDSSILSRNYVRGDRWPVFVERDFDSYRAYYRYLPKGRTTLRYNVRYNTAGTFQLPPVRVEAMYAPEMHAALPIDPMAIR